MVLGVRVGGYGGHSLASGVKLMVSLDFTLMVLVDSVQPRMVDSGISSSKSVLL